LFFKLALLLVASTVVAQYVGKEACGGCHPRQASLHLESGHARALAAGGAKADWAFGSGTHAVTWVKQLDAEHYLELGQSWFRATGALRLTPGHKDSAGVKYRVFDPGAGILKCFSCHSTGVPKVLAGGKIGPAEPGVNCEVCHGPGKAHVESGGGKYKIDNPARYRASAVNEQCGACHRQQAAGGEAPNWDDPWNVRHQPVYLVESRCFQESGEKLSCFSCHKPHEKLSRDKQAFDAVCASCHSGVKHKTAAAAKAGCVGCHMPVVKPTAELGFSNHWIGVYAPGKLLRPRR